MFYLWNVLYNFRTSLQETTATLNRPKKSEACADVCVSNTNNILRTWGKVLGTAIFTLKCEQIRAQWLLSPPPYDQNQSGKTRLWTTLSLPKQTQNLLFLSAAMLHESDLHWSSIYFQSLFNLERQLQTKF